MKITGAYGIPNLGRVLVLRAAGSLVPTGAAEVWIDVAYEGEWYGHPDGPFELTKAHFSDVIRNFDANPNAIPLDYEHSSEFLSEAPAAGWVKRFEIRPGEDGLAHLWALCDLTDKAASRIKAGEYKYSSGVFDFRAKDKKTGKAIGCEMPSLALTNQPFIRGSEPIMLSARMRLTGDSRMKVSVKDLVKQLKQIGSEELTPEQVMAALEFLKATMGGEEPAEEVAAAEDGAEPAEAEEEEKIAASASTSEETVTATADAPEAVAAAEPPAEAAPADPVAALAELMGMEPAAVMEALQANLEAVAALLSGGGESEGEEAPAGEVALTAKVLGSKVKALSAQVAELQAYKSKRDDEDAEHAVSVLVETGRILDDAREDFRALYLSNRASFDRIAASLPETVPVGEHAASTKPPTEATPAIDEDDPDVKALRRQLNATRRLTKAEKDRAVIRMLNNRAKSRKVSA